MQSQAVNGARVFRALQLQEPEPKRGVLEIRLEGDKLLECFSASFVSPFALDASARFHRAPGRSGDVASTFS